MIGIIYCIHNTRTGKKYIGQTTGNLNKRVMRHFRTINDTKISRSIVKYGKENFIYGIIEEICDKNDLDKKEEYWIKYYDTVNAGYNIKYGGKSSSGYKQTQKSIQKRIEKLKGKKLSEEHKLKISKSHLGKKLSPETINKMCKSRTGKPKSLSCRKKISEAHSKNYYKLTHKNGNFLVIKNLAQYCRDNNLNQSYFSRILKGERKSYKGWSIEKLDKNKISEYTNNIIDVQV